MGELMTPDKQSRSVTANRTQQSSSNITIRAVTNIAQIRGKAALDVSAREGHRYEGDGVPARIHCVAWEARDVRGAKAVVATAVNFLSGWCAGQTSGPAPPPVS